MLGNCESDGCGDPAVTEDYDDGLDKIPLCASHADVVRWWRNLQRSNEVASGDQERLS